MIYLDNAATSHPKPTPCLRRALARYLELGASPGRGGYDRAVQAEAEVEAVRRRLLRFFGAADKARVCFAANATDALNTMILGLARPGDHIVTSRLEHNSVLRPLHHLHQQGVISLTMVPANPHGYLEPATIAGAIGPATRLVILTHGSNVLGTVQPVAEIGRLCRQRGVPLLLDVAQTAGVIPIKMKEWQVSGLAFTGHKSLLGPSGIGGLVLSEDLDPVPTRFGGTGIDSANLLQPSSFPQRLEAGTINLLGILALGETLVVVEAGMEKHFSWEMDLFSRLVAGLRAMPRVRLYGIAGAGEHLPLLSCTVDGMAASDFGAILDGDFGIAARAGLHCAPLLHQDLGTAPGGTVRFSLGPSTNEAEIDAVIRAMAVIAA